MAKNIRKSIYLDTYTGNLLNDFLCKNKESFNSFATRAILKLMQSDIKPDKDQKRRLKKGGNL